MRIILSIPKSCVELTQSHKPYLYETYRFIKLGITGLYNYNYYNLKVKIIKYNTAILMVQSNLFVSGMSKTSYFR